METSLQSHLSDKNVARIRSTILAEAGGRKVFIYLLFMYLINSYAQLAAYASDMVAICNQSSVDQCSTCSADPSPRCDVTLLAY